MRTICLLLATALLSNAGVAMADDAKKDDAKSDKPKMIGRVDRTTGSLTRTNRNCMTQEDWDKYAASSDRDMNNFVKRQNDLAAQMPKAQAGGGGW